MENQEQGRDSFDVLEVRGVRFGGRGEVIREDQKRAALGVGMIGVPGTKRIM